MDELFFYWYYGKMGIIRWLTMALSLHPQEPSRVERARIGRRQGKTTTDPGYAIKRRYERFPVEGRALKAKAVLAEIIELLNVSLGGACIVTTRTLRPGDNVLLRIPDEKVETPLKCTIIWEAASDRPLGRDGGHVPAYRAGVKFNDVPPGTIIRLKDFMRSAGVPEESYYDKGHAPGPLRFSVQLIGKALMNYSAVFPVKKISLGGMQIETASELEIDERYPAALYLPDSGRPLRFNGRVASKIPLDSGFDAGVEFCEMSEEDRSHLTVFIESLAAQQ